MKQACSQVEATERMLLEMLDAVGRDILHPIRVSLEKSEKFTYVLLASFVSSYTLLLFASITPVSWCCWCAYAPGVTLRITNFLISVISILIMH
jgi:hypothetical protein